MTKKKIDVMNSNKILGNRFYVKMGDIPPALFMNFHEKGLYHDKPEFDVERYMLDTEYLSDVMIDYIDQISIDLFDGDGDSVGAIIYRGCKIKPTISELKSDDDQPIIIRYSVEAQKREIK